MSPIKRSGHLRNKSTTGSGLVNTLINKLPFELHIPGYQFCGPGTKLKERLARGDQGINPLDAACRKHDIAYSQNKNNLNRRHQADYELEQRAWERVKSEDASTSEKAAAWLVTNIMKTKQRFGMGHTIKNMDKKRQVKCRRRGKINKKQLNNKRGKRVSKMAFGSALRQPIRAELKRAGGKKFAEKDLMNASRIAVAVAKRALKSVGGKRKIRTPRIIPIPKVGGILPLIPIFAGLSALGSLAGGAASIARAINTVKDSKNKKSGEIITFKGSGLYLKPYRAGLGLFLSNKPKNY